jgi:hypothetical protein
LPGSRGGRVHLGTLPRDAAGTLVELVKQDLTTMDHEDGCSESGESESCTTCLIYNWTREVNVSGR